jgi:hypothetical protein
MAAVVDIVAAAVDTVAAAVVLTKPVAEIGKLFRITPVHTKNVSMVSPADVFLWLF